MYNIYHEPEEGIIYMYNIHVHISRSYIHSVNKSLPGVKGDEIRVWHVFTSFFHTPAYTVMSSMTTLLPFYGGPRGVRSVGFLFQLMTFCDLFQLLRWKEEPLELFSCRPPWIVLDMKSMFTRCCFLTNLHSWAIFTLEMHVLNNFMRLPLDTSTPLCGIIRYNSNFLD